MNKKIILIAILFIFCCDNSINNKWENGQKLMNENKLMESITIFNNIISKHPDSKFSVKAQFQIAEIYLNNKKDYNIAIEEFSKVINNFPNTPESKNSLFMISYIYNNYLNEYSNAIINYNKFLKKYPDDDLIPSVNYELETLKKYQTQIDSLNKTLKNNDE